MSENEKNPTTELSTLEETPIPSLAGLFGRSVESPTPYVSFRPETASEKARLYRAMTTPDYKVADCINQVVRLTDVYVERVEVADQETGEVALVPRVVLFDADGKTYAATSRGIANSLERLFMVYGQPHWNEAIPVKIQQVQNGARRFFTLVVVEE